MTIINGYFTQSTLASLILFYTADQMFQVYIEAFFLLQLECYKPYETHNIRPRPTISSPDLQYRARHTISGPQTKQRFRSCSKRFSPRTASKIHEHIIYIPRTGLLSYLIFIFHNKDYTIIITLYKDVARGPQETTRFVRGGPLVTIILSNRNMSSVMC